MSLISERVNLILEHYGISKKELAEKAGVSKQAVGNWAQRGTMPGAEAAIMLAETIGLNPRWLIFGEEPMVLMGVDDLFISEMRSLSPHLSERSKASILSIARDLAEPARGQSQ